MNTISRIFMSIVKTSLVSDREMDHGRAAAGISKSDTISLPMNSREMVTPTYLMSVQNSSGHLQPQSSRPSRAPSRGL